jgi:hypothetical protein
MMDTRKLSGREHEVNEIVNLMRAAEVGRLMMGELNGPMKWISSDQFIHKTRQEIKERRGVLRKHLRKEIAKFCRNNFADINPKTLGCFYEPLYAHGSSWRLPMLEFIELLGCPKEGVLKGAPLHSTIALSPWGLQTEFPEMHLIKDLSVALNSLLETEDKLDKLKPVRWHNAKENDVRSVVADLQRQAAFLRRMCVLSCFNLVEAYINGIAWEYVQTTDISSLSNKKQKILTEGQVSILDKLVKIPPIVADQSPGPLEKDTEPLVTFKNAIKPFRDSIVHASPFSAPERFGGYEKLSKVYELNTDTVKRTVKMTLEMIGMLYRFFGGQKHQPQWVPERNEKGGFVISN